MKNKLKVLVLGGGTNAIGQIRTAHDAGYDCINIVEKSIHSFSASSRFCQGYISPHPFKERAACLSFTISIIKSLPDKPYLFCASDEWMDMLGENEKEFRSIGHIIQSPWAETVQLYNKKHLYRLAEEHGIPFPKTIELDSLKSLPSVLGELAMPCIIKPQLTVSQNEIKESKLKAYHRTQSFETVEEAITWSNSMLDNGLDFPVLVQEYIPGDATNLYTLTSYSDRQGKLVAGSIGHKMRQFPPKAGRITSGILCYEDGLREISENFLKTIHYNGVANTEFKYDPRDGKYKLMEINARFGAWNYSVLYSGLNLMKIAIDDYNGQEYNGPVFKTEKDGHIWYNLPQDMGGAVILCRNKEFKKYQLSFFKWIKSLGKNHFESVFTWKDPIPFFNECWYLLKDMISL